MERGAQTSLPEKMEKRTISVDPKAPKCNQTERLFRYFDGNGDGKISPAELQSCVKIVGGELSEEEAATLVSSGDGLLGFDDFAKLLEADGEKEEEEDLREAFSMYEEKAGSGRITPKSLKKMLSRLDESRTIEECKAMISTFDLNGDGVLSFEEFRAMMR
ncbi:putative calcium-binding protein CML19 [Telopea speciosissima]|uniref:putative calcium-binding protein CML19 n=1 Tax=Telopea speciosissima TaxID=54955 RepID=UPI001CC827A1|nr:putative calcium-binding protein CML19 [Telopea speciosissima]